MGRQRSPDDVLREVPPPPLLSAEQWRAVIETMELSPQQARIVARILQGKQDKQIAAELELSRETVRTYLKRIFQRLGFEDRLGLVLSVFTICLKQRDAQACPL